MARPTYTGIRWLDEDSPRLPPSAHGSGEGADNRKLFVGTLRGYRHLAVTETTRHPDPWLFASPAYQNYRWSAGENRAWCGHLEEADQETLSRRRGEVLHRVKGLEDRIDALTKRTPARSHSSHWWNYDFLTTDSRTLFDALEEAKRSLARIDRTARERERYERGEHRLDDCSCGFYASYSPATDFYNRSRSVHAHTVVECYGRIVPGTRGFRAQKMKIVAMAPALPRRVWTTQKLGLSPDAWPCEETACVWSPSMIRDVGVVAKRQFPDTRWFDDHADMIQAYPEPDRSGLADVRQSEYGT